MPYPHASRSGGWGIQVPGRSNQVVYVWIDALINYLSGQGFGTNDQWKNTWNDETKKIHVIGKNVWKFHAIYWPALLLSADLSLPNEILIHGFLTTDGEKISKSLGNSIDPQTFIDNVGSDCLRHFLLTHLSLYQDADFSLNRLQGVYNDDFANTLGNLVSRIAVLLKNADQGSFFSGVPAAGTALSEVLVSYDIGSFSRNLWDRLRKVNAEINHTKPWELIKNGDPSLVKSLLDQWTLELFEVTKLLSCLIPTSGGQVLRALDEGLQNLNAPLFPRKIGKDGKRKDTL